MLVLAVPTCAVFAVQQTIGWLPSLLALTLIFPYQFAVTRFGIDRWTRRCNGVEVKRGVFW